MKTKDLEKNVDFFAAFALSLDEMMAIRGGDLDGGEDPQPIPPTPPIKY